MKILVLSAHDGTLPFARMSQLSHEEYATRHGYDYLLASFHRESEGKGHPAWQKLGVIFEAIMLARHDWILWLDADTVITNYPMRFDDQLDQAEREEKFLLASKDWSDGESPWSAGAMFIRVCQDARDFFMEAERRKHFMNMGCWDQSAMQEVARTIPRFERGIHVVPRRVLQSVPERSGVLEPWQPGDFLCHATGMMAHDKLPVMIRCNERAVR